MIIVVTFRYRDRRTLLARHLVSKANGLAMLRLFLRLLKNENGFTAPECGILVCLTVIFAEKLALNIEPFRLASRSKAVIAKPTYSPEIIDAHPIGALLDPAIQFP